MDFAEQRLAESIGEKLRKLIEGEPDDAIKVIKDIDAEIVVVYVAAIQRVIEEWLRWEAVCKDRALNVEDRYCSELEARISSSDASIGVVSYFNTHVKRLLVRLVRDFAPFAVLPSWVVFYSTFVLKEPVVLHIAKLGPSEQLLRAPAYAAALCFLDAASRGLEEHYRDIGADIALATASYIYWELVRPLSLYVDVYEKIVGVDSTHIRDRIILEARAKGHVNKVSDYVTGLHDLYAKALIERIRRSRGKATSN